MTWKTLKATPSKAVGINEQPAKIHVDSLRVFLEVEKNLILQCCLKLLKERPAQSFQDHCCLVPSKVIPTISEIIHNHTPPSAIAISSQHLVGRSSSLYTTSSHRHATLRIESEPEPSAHVGMGAEDSELLSRSSIDNVADEDQQTICKQSHHCPQLQSLPPPTPSTAFRSRYSMVSEQHIFATFGSRCCPFRFQLLSTFAA